MALLDLLDAFPAQDHQRIVDTLDALRPGILGRYMVVGGAAIRYGLLEAGVQAPLRPFNDLDLVADGPGSFDDLMSAFFLVHHFHVSGPESDFRFVLVHRTTGTKIDIFHWKPAVYAMDAASYAGGANSRHIPLQDLSTQFAVTVYDLETMRRRGPVDPKQLSDAEAMWPHIRLADAEASWDSLFDGNAPLALIEAFEAAKRRRGSEADFAAKPWQSHNTHYKCAKCVQSDLWPIAPMQEVYDLLGYIEIDGDNIA